MKNLHSRKGNVLIVVLIMTAFVLTLVMSLYEKAGNSYTGVVNVQADNQGAIYAGTALTIVRQLMELDDPEYDAPLDQWTMLPAIPVEGGFVVVSIKPADDRLPINSLFLMSDNGSERIQSAFEYMFADLGYEGNLWQNLHDWINPIDNATKSVEVNDIIFNTEGSSYTAKHAPMTSLYEMLMVPGFAPYYRELSSYLCIGDAGTPKININFADPLTIRALLPELSSYVDQIVETRVDNPFKTKDALYALMGTSNQEAYTAILPYFDVKSTSFYVKIEVNILETVQYYHALLKRNGRRFALVGYIEGRSIDYF